MGGKEGGVGLSFSFMSSTWSCTHAFTTNNSPTHSAIGTCKERSYEQEAMSCILFIVVFFIFLHSIWMERNGDRDGIREIVDAQAKIQYTNTVRNQSKKRMRRTHIYQKPVRLGPEEKGTRAYLFVVVFLLG